MKSIFHLAYNVRNLDDAREFYVNTLGCKEGRSAATWIDLDFFGHQLSLHIGEPFLTKTTGKVGEHIVPMPHLGIILQYKDWQNLAKKLEEKKTNFVIKPVLRFEGLPGEQYTMFFKDPFGNPIEAKGFKDLSKVFDS
ncbi:MAG: VOC family protein [Campylobacteraceae bacterium]|nr:VOC family protein [Campylobacteraceae bacterium]